MADTDADRLKQIREDFDTDMEFWADIRAEQATDMKYVALDPWDAADRAARKAAGRPCISLDELGQYFNQIIGDVLANPKAIKFSPKGYGATEKTAELYENKVREIQYRSKAQQAYIAAFTACLYGSYGYVRVKTKVIPGERGNQDLWIEPIPNPNMVLPDSHAQRPDGSDMRRCHVFETWKQAEFKRRWPKATITDFSTDVAAMAPAWVKGDSIIVAEYWAQTVAKTPMVVVMLPDGRGEQEMTRADYDANMDKSNPALVEWDEEAKTVTHDVTNGVELLESTPWPGSYIPISACYGKRLYVDEGAGPKLKIMSMTRPARDPYMAYCFAQTCVVENIGSTTKNPYWAYEGQLSQDQMNAIAKSMHAPVAVLLAKATTEATGSQILPLPQRSLNAPQIESLSMHAEAMRRAIQAAMGVSPLPTQAQRQNQKSGVALKQIEESGQRGSYHFIDAFNGMVEHTGVIIEDLLDKIIDNPRTTAVRLPNDTNELIRVNDPNDPKSVSTKGSHLVTVSVGPSHDSEREAASDFADTLMGALPPQAASVMLPKVIKLKNLGPIGDELMKLAEKMVPPEMRDQPEEGQPPDPAALQSQMAQMQQQMQQMGQMLQQAQQEIQTEGAKQQATIQKAQIDASAQVRKAEIDAQTQLEIQQSRNATSIAVAHIQAAAKGAAIDAHAAEEAQALGHESQERGEDRSHEMAMSSMQHEHGLESSERMAQMQPVETEDEM